VAIGDEVKIKVLDIDRDRQRISLGLKQTQEDPWQRVVSTYRSGDVLEGTVTKVVSFGAFVEILDGVEGLVHISELADHHVENPAEVVELGANMNVKILEIDEERRRLSLSIKRVEGQNMLLKDLGAAIQAASGAEEPAEAETVEADAVEEDVAPEVEAEVAEAIAEVDLAEAAEDAAEEAAVEEVVAEAEVEAAEEAVVEAAVEAAEEAAAEEEVAEEAEAETEATEEAAEEAVVEEAEEITAESAEGDEQS
jgi:small subunit ribosomal protein S1